MNLSSLALNLVWLISLGKYISKFFVSLPFPNLGLSQNRGGLFYTQGHTRPYMYTHVSYKGRRRWHPLQYSCLENPMDGGAWEAAVHGVTKSQTRLSNFTFTFHFHALEKEMATHSSVLAWRIPGTGEPGGLLSMGSHRVGHDWSDLAAAAAAKRKSETCVRPQKETCEFSLTW